MKFSAISEKAIIDWLLTPNWQDSHRSDMKLFHKMVKTIFDEHGLISSEIDLYNSIVPLIQIYCAFKIDKETEKILENLLERAVLILFYLQDERESKGFSTV